MSGVIISFDEYCSKYGKDPNDEKSKILYDSFVENTKDNEDLNDKHRSGKMPGMIFD